MTARGYIIIVSWADSPPEVWGFAATYEDAVEMAARDCAWELEAGSGIDVIEDHDAPIPQDKGLALIERWNAEIEDQGGMVHIIEWAPLKMDEARKRRRMDAYSHLPPEAFTNA